VVGCKPDGRSLITNETLIAAKIIRLMKTCVKNLYLSPATLVISAMMLATSMFAAPVKPPSLTVTAPKTGAKWSNEVYSAAGTVTKGSAGIANVFVSVNAGGWTPATRSNATWKAQIILALGNNTFSAYAVDTNGVPSETNTATITYIYAPPLVSITAPKTGAKWSNDVYAVTGTVTPVSAGISGVFVSDNDGGWNTAQRSNTNWNEEISLTAGSNSIAAYAVDTNGVASKTNTVTLIYVPRAILTLNIVGEGTVSPDYSNSLLTVGGHYTMTATPAKGFGFYFWNVGGSMTSSETVKFTMASNLVITANFKDITPPMVTITSPKAGGKYTNTVIQVAGTASDNVGVTDVEVLINGGDWVTASGTSNWVASLPMNTGNNTVEAVALDAAGNVSKTNTVNFLGEAPAQQFWAPPSLTNSLVKLLPFGGSQIELSFGATMFNWSDTNSTFDYADAGVGHYEYQEISTNFILAQLSFNGPPIVNGNTVDVAFLFTNFDTGIYTNYFNLETGSFSIATGVTSLLPTTWGGLQFTISEAKKVIGVLHLSKVGTYVLNPTNGDTVSGTFNATDFGPMGAFLTFESTLTTGETLAYYLQLTYTAQGKGMYTAYEYSDGSFFRLYQGTFTSP